MQAVESAPVLHRPNNLILASHDSADVDDPNHNNEDPAAYL